MHSAVWLRRRRVCVCVCVVLGGGLPWYLLISWGMGARRQERYGGQALVCVGTWVWLREMVCTWVGCIAVCVCVCFLCAWVQTVCVDADCAELCARMLGRCDPICWCAVTVYLGGGFVTTGVMVCCAHTTCGCCVWQVAP